MSGETDPGSDLARLYREAIRRHSSDPVGYREEIGATHRHESYNPQCGDRVEVMLRVAHGRIEAAAFHGEACAICMASASLLCHLAPGRSVDGLRQLGKALEAALNEPAGAAVGAASAAIGFEANQGQDTRKSRLKPLLQPQLRPLLGVRPYPSRIRCATLPWTAAERALTEPERS